MMLLPDYTGTSVQPWMPQPAENLFRFLAKPCEQDVLVKAITSAGLILVQYRLVHHQKKSLLMEKTLMRPAIIKV